ncbi:MAG: hypothetical protein KDA75_16270, partial [Planctomycetaceae bacterium]|nr:hypothetical protein [Planctomycetaceae bacterium]
MQALIAEGVTAETFDLDKMPFAVMEQFGHGRGRERAQRIQTALAQAARVNEQAGEQYGCVHCGRSCRADARRRRLETLDGAVEFAAPKNFCNSCRKALLSQREVLRIARETFSPGVRKQVVRTAVEVKSFARAEAVLQVVGEVTICGRQIGRIAREQGRSLLDEQHERAEAHQRKESPVEVENPPELSVVQMDGGRLRTRQPGRGPGTHDPAWKETTNALFLRPSSAVNTDDTGPEPPDSLQNRGRLCEQVPELSGAADGVEPLTEVRPPEPSGDCYRGPRTLFRTCLSSLDDVHSSGRLMAAEARHKAFYAAPRRAFLGDSMKCNWNVWQQHFPTFTPIIDFLRAVSDVYHAAVAIAGEEDFGRGLCLDAGALAGTGRRRDRRTRRMAREATGRRRSAPRRRHAPHRAVGDRLPDQQPAADALPRVPPAGLPITSSLMESLVKEINWRVKGTEKFWNKNRRCGAHPGPQSRRPVRRRPPPTITPRTSPCPAPAHRTEVNCTVEIRLGLGRSRRGLHLLDCGPHAMADLRLKLAELTGPGALAGVTLGDWLKLLIENRFRLHPLFWGRVGFISVSAPVTSVVAVLERAMFAGQYRATEIPGPLFLLGGWRCGTTHLHNLFALDERFGYSSLFQTMYPHTFLTSQWWWLPVLAAMTPRKRWQDNVSLSLKEPAQDEMALCIMTRRSSMLGWVFPHRFMEYERFLDFDDVSERDVRLWKTGFREFLHKLTWKNGGRPSVLKSPY